MQRALCALTARSGATSAVTALRNRLDWYKHLQANLDISQATSCNSGEEISTVSPEFSPTPSPGGPTESVVAFTGDSVTLPYVSLQVNLFGELSTFDALVFSRCPLVRRNHPNFAEILYKAEDGKNVLAVTTRQQSRRNAEEDKSLEQQQEEPEASPFSNIIGDDYDFVQTNLSVPDPETSTTDSTKYSIARLLTRMADRIRKLPTDRRAEWPT